MIRFRTAALTLALSVGAASLAAAQSTTVTPPNASAGAHAHRAERGPGRRIGRRLFNGIDLTADQRQRIQKVHESYRQQWQRLREQMRPAMQEARAARQRGDTAAARAAFARTADERQQLAALTDRVRVDARAALDPEHRTQFDANVARMKERLANRVDRWQDGRGGRREGGKAKRA